MLYGGGWGGSLTSTSFGYWQQFIDQTMDQTPVERYLGTRSMEMPLSPSDAGLCVPLGPIIPSRCPHKAASNRMWGTSPALLRTHLLSISKQYGLGLGLGAAGGVLHTTGSSTFRRGLKAAGSTSDETAGVTS